MNKRNSIIVELKLRWDQFRNGVRQAKQDISGFGGAMTAVAAAAGVYLLNAVQNLIGGLVDMQRKLVNLGLELEKVKVRLQLLAGGAGAAEAYITAIQEATGGMVDQMTAAKIATSALNYEIANTPDEVAELTRKILILSGGNVDLADSFMYLLSNGVTSIERLNEFGLSSARVRARMAELRDTTDDYNSEAAFMQAVLEEVDQKVNTLSDSLDTNAAKVQTAQTLWKDFWQDLAEASILYTTQTDLIDQIGEAVLRMAGLAEESGTRVTNAFLIPMAAQQALLGTLNSISNGTTDVADAADTFSEAFQYALVALRAVSTEESRAANEAQALAAAQDRAADSADKLADKTERVNEALKKAHAADPFAFDDIFDPPDVSDISDSLQGVAEVLRRDSDEEMTDEEFAKIILGQLRRADAPPEIIWAFRKASGLATASEIARERYMVELVNAAARGEISADVLWSESQRVRAGGAPGQLPTVASGAAGSIGSGNPVGAAQLSGIPGETKGGEQKIVLELRGDLADMIDARLVNGLGTVMRDSDTSSTTPVARLHFNRKAGH